MMYRGGSREDCSLLVGNPLCTSFFAFVDVEAIGIIVSLLPNVLFLALRSFPRLVSVSEDCLPLAWAFFKTLSG